MKSLFWITLPLSLALLLGCGHEAGDGHEHEHDHDHEAEESGGPLFESGKGILLPAGTRTSLGLAVGSVEVRRLANQIPLTVQVFGEKHHHHFASDDHAGCDVHGSAFLSTEVAALVRSGQAVEVRQSTNAALSGVVLAVQKALALGEAEIVIGVSNAAAVLKPGEFVPAHINIPRDHAVTAVPLSSLLRTAVGKFVYVVNGEAVLRTEVKTGAEADGWIEITDGLRAGQQVVTSPVQALWLLELRATKGGGHSH